jgi:hypothetical protein
MSETSEKSETVVLTWKVYMDNAGKMTARWSTAGPLSDGTSHGFHLGAEADQVLMESLVNSLVVNTRMADRMEQKEKAAKECVKGGGHHYIRTGGSRWDSCSECGHEELCDAPLFAQPAGAGCSNGCRGSA